MQIRSIKKILLIFGCIFSFAFINKTASAQNIKYSSENVFIDFADHLQIVTNISGNNHLLNFIYEEKPVIFIFDHDLRFLSKVKIPYKFPEHSEIRIIPFDDFYYIYIHPPNSDNYFFGKVEGNGNFTNMSEAFQKLIHPQSHYTTIGFQLISNEKKFCLVYHIYLPNLQKNQLIILQTDSLLNVVSTKNIFYQYKGDEERLQQELLTPKFLYVLKAAHGGTSLTLLKVNVSNSLSITNTFRSAGYLYTQPAFSITDSGVTVYSMLREPRSASKIQHYIFISKLDLFLNEQAPFAVFKSQFLKNTFINFFMIEGFSNWLSLQKERVYYTYYESNPGALPDFTNDDPTYVNRAFSSTPGSRQVRYYADDQSPGVRFSLLDKRLDLANDSLVPNNKNSYTINADQFVRFRANNKSYLLLDQRFYKRKRGLLMLSSMGNNLLYNDLRVNDRFEYLLSQSRIVSQGVIVPYLHRREAGLIKITFE